MRLTAYLCNDPQAIAGVEAVSAVSAIELVGIDADAAFRAAERQVCDGALPGHEHRETFDLFKRDARMEADAALSRTAPGRVLDAVAGETSSCPSSSMTGTETMSVRSGVLRNLCMPGSRFSARAALSS